MSHEPRSPWWTEEIDGGVGINDSRSILEERKAWLQIKIMNIRVQTERTYERRMKEAGKILIR